MTAVGLYAALDVSLESTSTRIIDRVGGPESRFWQWPGCFANRL